MEDYRLALLSKYCHNEGHLGLALEGLKRLGLAVEGFTNGNYLMRIVYDLYENPHILFKRSDVKRVKKELKKSIIQDCGIVPFEGILESIYDESLDMKIRKNSVRRLHSITLN